MKTRLKSLSRLLFLFVSMFVFVSSAAIASGMPKTVHSSSLMVKLSSETESELSAERVVSVLSFAPSSPRAMQLKVRLGNPVGVSYLITNRLTDSNRAELGTDHPLNTLQSFVVLNYRTPLDARLAKLMIGKDVSINVFDGGAIKSSATPNDPFYNTVLSGAGVTTQSQNSVYAQLNLENAWNIAQGTAYVSVVEAYGVEGLHPDLAPNIRGHFSRNQPFTPPLPGPITRVNLGSALIEATGAGALFVRTQNSATGARYASPGSSIPNGPCLNVSGTVVLPWSEFCRTFWDGTVSRPLGPTEWGDFATDAYVSELIADHYIFWQVVRRGHGTHVAGILAASGNNGLGGTGVCWNCSVAVQRVPTGERFASAIIEAIDNGAQVVNFSAGLSNGAGAAILENVCLANSLVDPRCIAINYAKRKNVLFAAASGNTADDPITQFPAIHPDVLSVGGSDENGLPGAYSANNKVDFFAPGLRILSTFVEGYQWAGGLGGVPLSGCAAHTNSNMGLCSGTSMSSPMIAGALALVRSANPLLSNSQTKSALLSFQGTHGRPYLPNVAASVQHAISGPSGNRGLTPLFTMYNATTRGYFSTTVPQMVSAASCSTLRVGAQGRRPGRYDSAKGLSVANLAAVYPETIESYPASLNRPALIGSCMYGGTPLLASTTLFTTVSRAGVALKPLYRYSSDPLQGQVGEQNVADHHYFSDLSDVPVLCRFCVKDGIEGYVYPSTSPQPAGTEKLLRRWAYDFEPGYFRWVSAVFPESRASEYAAEGYIYSLRAGDFLGYVCPLQNQTGICAAPYTP